MKNLFLFLGFIVPFVIYKYYFSQSDPEPESQTPIEESELQKVKICKDRAQSKSSSLNYLGPSLISSSSDPKDLVLCPGDAFGDLNETYITVKNCYLAMYHQDKMIWSSKIKPRYRYLPEDEGKCAFSVQRDGNLALYLEGEIMANPGGRRIVAWTQWDSQTNLNPKQTELRILNQQVQIIQTFEDGAQRLFYADANYQEFREDLGEPLKVANKFIIKNHQDEDKTILKRNEYIGDLNGTHLILQTNCDLQLLNKDKVLWSFTPPFKHEMNCVLNLQDKDQISLSKIPSNFTSSTNREDFPYDSHSIITKKDSSLEVLESRISFEDDQPIVIQTLKNGSEITFSSGLGNNTGFKLKRQPRQISENTITVSKDHLNEFSIERMDYIGNLTGLHLILEQNCSLILANGNEKLWEFQSELQYFDRPVMDCSITIHSDGLIFFNKEYVGVVGGGEIILKRVFSNLLRDITEVQLKLEDNKLVIIRERGDGAPEVYHAGQISYGTLLQFISENSLIIHPGKKILSKMNYIGDINGVFLVFEDICKWVLYNKTEVIWESGRFLSDDETGGCTMVMKKDGVRILTREISKESWLLWSIVEPSSDAKVTKVMKMELLVNNDGLWMVQTLDDGTERQVNLGQLEWTNKFGLLSKKPELLFNSDL